MESAVFVFVALLAGLGLGWFFGRRPLADLQVRVSEREKAFAELDERFRRAITDLAAASERAARADTLAHDLDRARADMLRAQGDLATLRAQAEHFEEQKRLLLESQDQLRREFEVAGARVLEKAQEAFLAAQQERLKLTDLRFKNGIASSLDQLDAQRDLFSAQQALIQARQLRLNNAIDLYKALGGGLNENTVSVAAKQ